VVPTQDIRQPEGVGVGQARKGCTTDTVSEGEATEQSAEARGGPF